MKKALLFVIAAGLVLATPGLSEAAHGRRTENVLWGAGGLVLGGALGYTIGRNERSYREVHPYYRPRCEPVYTYSYDYYAPPPPPGPVVYDGYYREKYAFPFYHKVEYYPTPQINVTRQTVNLAEVNFPAPRSIDRVPIEDPAPPTRLEPISPDGDGEMNANDGHTTAPAEPAKPININIGDGNSDVQIHINDGKVDTNAATAQPTYYKRRIAIPNSPSLPGRYVHVDSIEEISNQYSR